MSLKFKQNKDGSWTGYRANQSHKQNPEPFNEQQTKPSKFDDMSDEQLADYAEKLGVDISRVRSREAAILKIEKAEQENNA